MNFIGFPVIFKTKDSSIRFGKNCTVKSDFLSNLVGLYQRTIVVARDGGEIQIGDNVGMSGATIYSIKKIKIGDYTSIGGNTKIIDNDFHPIDSKERMQDDRTAIKSVEINIGKHVFIGCNSIILKGTELGDNCVVGAGSVVTGKFPDNSVIAGNPARIIRML